MDNDSPDSYDKHIIDPQERLRHLINYCNSVEVDYNIPPTRYYRSGLEMVRMANVYYNEGSLENAYVLYLKFLTLFVEKIRKHPAFPSVPVSVKAINQAKLREILPRAEKLKQRLLKLYEDDYKRYSNELREKSSELRRSMTSRPIAMSRLKSYAQIEIPESIKNIIYPDPDVPAGSAPATISTVSIAPLAPRVDRSVKPHLSDLQAFDNSDLRTVVIPDQIMNEFLQKANKNTLNNIETCGILVGHLARNELTVTHLIIPKQNGTPDSCTTMNEEELFDYQDQLNLITIGWIHTHPTQTAFLSSVDLHTHCPYQLLMPEAIAIVCAPRYSETGFFVLTPDYGLKYIANCRKTGFHPHPTEPPLFTVAEHVRLESNAKLEVLDLRHDAR